MDKDAPLTGRAGGPSAEWRAVAGYEDYEVSSLGQVRSYKFGHPRLMSLVPNSDGYPTVRLSRDGRDRRFYIHRLVCTAFHGEQPAGHEVAHLDGSKTNARADNLKWCSPTENCAHKIRHGTRQSGERNGRARMTSEMVEAVRWLSSQGASERSIAREVGVSKTAVHRVLVGETWND